jgi:hypothetical protein
MLPKPPLNRPPAPHVAAALAAIQTKLASPAPAPRQPAPHVAAALGRTGVPARQTGAVQPSPAPRPVALRPAVAARAGTLQRMESRSMAMSSTRSRSAAQAILELAVGILKTKYEDIKLMYNKPGGWEWWFQGELYLAISKNMQLPPLVETSVYGNKQKTDFCFLTQDGKDLVIELKCEGLYNQDKFAGEVAKDTQKLNQFKGPGYGIQIAISCKKTGDVQMGGKAVQVGELTLHYDKREA